MILFNRIFQIYIKYFSLTPFIHNISFSLYSFINNNDLLFKCKQLFYDNISENLKDEFFNILEFREKDNKKKLIRIQNKFFNDLLEGFDNEYLEKNIKRKINIDSLMEEQVISFKIIKYQIFVLILS